MQKESVKAPEPQPTKRRQLDDKMGGLTLGKRPAENDDDSLDADGKAKPPKKLKREAKLKQKFKTVNKVAKKSSGWGRMRRHGISKFYTDVNKAPDRLLYLLTKYKQRSGWSHKQVLGYAHPKMTGEDKTAKDLILTYCTRGYKRFSEMAAPLREQMVGGNQSVLKIIGHIDMLQEISKLSATVQNAHNLQMPNEEDEKKLLEFLRGFGTRTERELTEVTYAVGNIEPAANPGGLQSAFQIVREHIPTGFLKSVKVRHLELQII